MTTDQRFLDILATLDPEAPKRWAEADEIGRVSMAFAISNAVKRTLGEAKGKIAFAIIFQQATHDR